jgi:hypothetical protein
VEESSPTEQDRRAMPSRLACLALLLYWLVAAEELVRYDLLPDLSVGAPPDLRTIAAAGENEGRARWSIMVAGDPSDPATQRSVGRAETVSRRDERGWVNMRSTVKFDSARLFQSLLKIVPGASAVPSQQAEEIEFDSVYDIDPPGNLRSFQADVRVAGQAGDLFHIDGTLEQRVMRVVSRGPLAILNRSMSFPYEPHAVVQSQFGPLDRLPGLQVGQRWDERVANPLTGQIETVRAEVKGKAMLHWDKGPVSTLEVVHRSKAMSARTWVRPDGLVLRQEVTLPAGKVRLLLDRIPETGGSSPRGPSLPARVNGR